MTRILFLSAGHVIQDFSLVPTDADTDVASACLAFHSAARLPSDGVRVRMTGRDSGERDL